ncbi:MAG: hypothetical protein PHF37_03305, partial [Phycisphaerae bacterium]|nr:hypothetical protein [Phycisphaerae bacterium]
AFFCSREAFKHKRTPSASLKWVIYKKFLSQKSISKSSAEQDWEFYVHWRLILILSFVFI